MSDDRDLTAPALLLLAFGLAPWIDVGAWLLFENVVGPLGRGETTMLQIGLGASVGVGFLAALVAIVSGLVARRRTGRGESIGGGPRRARAGARRSATIARAASLIAVLGLWGPFGLALLERFVKGRRSLPDVETGQWIVFQFIQ